MAQRKKIFPPRTNQAREGISAVDVSSMSPATVISGASGSSVGPDRGRMPPVVPRDGCGSVPVDNPSEAIDALTMGEHKNA